MNKLSKTLSISFYTVYIFLIIITLFTEIGSVSENLDGWHDFSSSHSFIFVLICIYFILCATHNLKCIYKNNLNKTNTVINISMFTCPFIIKAIAKSLEGNVDTDFQYLILRNFQGFDNTYLLIALIGVAAFVCVGFEKIKELKKYSLNSKGRKL